MRAIHGQPSEGKGHLPPPVDQPARRLAVLLAVPVLGLLGFYATLTVNALRWTPALAYASEGPSPVLPAAEVWPRLKPASPSVEAGRKLYYRQGCASCHGIEGQGLVRNPNAKTGEQVPALIHVATDYSRVQLMAQIRKGAKVVDKLNKAAPDPPLRMPPFKDRLTMRQLSDLADFLNSLLPPEQPGEAW